jgi:hypothetical protein
MIPGIVVNALYIDLLPSQTGSKAWQILCLLSFLLKVIMARYRVVSSACLLRIVMQSSMTWLVHLVLWHSCLSEDHLSRRVTSRVIVATTASHVPLPADFHMHFLCRQRPRSQSAHQNLVSHRRLAKRHQRCESHRHGLRISTTTTTSCKSRHLSRQLATKARNTMEQDFNKQVYIRDAISRGLWSPSANENCGKGVKRPRMK